MKNNSSIVENHRYKILTPVGYQPFSGIRRIMKSSHYDVILSNGKTVKCSDNHRFVKNGEAVDIKTLKFYVNGSSVTDNIQPSVQILIKGIVNIKNKNMFKSFTLQTMTSQRSAEK